MFNISFAELMVIFLVTFLVLGPKEMTKVARFLGKAVKKSQKFIVDMKAFVNDNVEDTALKDMKDSVSEVKATMESVKSEVDKINPINDLKKEIQEEIKPIQEIKNVKSELNPVKKGTDALKKSN